MARFTYQVVIALAVLGGCATKPVDPTPEPADDTTTVKLSPGEITQCDAEGGCRWISFQHFKEAVTETAKKLREADEHDNDMECSRRAVFGK